MKIRPRGRADFDSNSFDRAESLFGGAAKNRTKRTGEGYCSTLAKRQAGRGCSETKTV